MKNIIYLFLIPILLFNCKPQQKEISDQESKEKPLVIFPDTLIEKNDSLNYVINMLYLDFENETTGLLRKVTNGFLHNNKYQFLKFIEDFDALSTRYFRGEYIVRHQDEKLLSILLQTQWQVPGTSRIIHHYKTTNLDLTENNFLKEKEYFIKKEMWDEFKKRIHQKMKEKCGYLPEKMNYDFTFSEEDGIFIVPFADMNPPECYNLTVQLKWEELEDILTEEGKEFL